MTPAKHSIQTQIEEIEDSLLLIAERKAAYVEETSISLDLLKNENRLQGQLRSLRQQLAELQADEPMNSETTVPSFASQQVDLADLLTKARTFAITGDLAQAIEIVNRVEFIDPHFPGLYVLKRELLPEMDKPWMRHGKVNPQLLMDYQNVEGASDSYVGVLKRSISTNRRLIVWTITLSLTLTIVAILFVAWELGWLAMLFQ